MASIVLNIAHQVPPVIRQVSLRARIGNEEQECPDQTVGDLVPAGLYFAQSLSSANALAAAELNCIRSQTWIWDLYQ